MPKLTIETIKNKVFENSLQTCEYISGYETTKSLITVKCLIHNLEFKTSFENVRRDSRKHHICPICQKEDKNKRYKNNRKEVECAYCKTKFFKSLSKLEKSKSGLYFCCREHKDLAQSLNSVKEFQIIRPEHYGSENPKAYRETAFKNYWKHKNF